MRRAACLILFLGSCGQPAPSENPDHQAVYDYQLALPAKFTRDPNILADDSKVEVWRSASIELTTDFGLYGGARQCGQGELACNIASVKIAGRPAHVARYRFAADQCRQGFLHAVAVHPPVVDHPGDMDLTLNVFARCNSAAQCEEALQLIRRVRIVEKRKPR